MKLFQFSFKSEPIWMLVFSFALPAVVGLLLLLLVLLLRWLG